MKNTNKVSIKFVYEYFDCISKYLTFPDLIIECSGNDLVSVIVDKFIQKTKININLKYKKYSW